MNSLDDVVLCDTGFIVALADRNDEFHASASYFFDSTLCQFFLPISVLVEAFHMLHRKRLDGYLHELVANPGAFRLIDDRASLAATGFKMRGTRPELDMVDCLLLVYAKSLAEEEGSKIPYAIVTIDSRMCGIAYGLSHSHRFHNLREAS